MDKIEEKLKKHHSDIIGLDRMKHCAVCIPLIETKDGVDILFEVRASSISQQPGDICLPGGSMEGDETPQQGAVRELCEELLIDLSQVEMMGSVDRFVTSSLIIYPFVVRLKDYKGTYSKDEVEEVFRVPLSFFMEHEPEWYRIDLPVVSPENFPYEKIVGGKAYNWRKRTEDICFYQYQDRSVWGLTAKIVGAFVEILQG